MNHRYLLCDRPPAVVSISWAVREADLAGTADMDLFNYYAAFASLMGVTLVAASGERNWSLTILPGACGASM